MEPFYADHLIARQARALDNRLPHLYVNRCGGEAGLEFVGGSARHPAGRHDRRLGSGGGERVLAAERRLAPEPTTTASTTSRICART